MVNLNEDSAHSFANAFLSPLDQHLAGPRQIDAENVVERAVFQRQRLRVPQFDLGVHSQTFGGYALSSRNISYEYHETLSDPNEDYWDRSLPSRLRSAARKLPSHQMKDRRDDSVWAISLYTGE